MIRKIALIIIIPIVIFGIIYPGILANTFLYFINGSSLQVGNYTINFPLGHWAYFNQDKLNYIISGRYIDGEALRIEIFKNPSKYDFKWLSKCNVVKKEYTNLSGKMFICKYDNKQMMYFLSNDKRLLLNSGDNFNIENKKMLQEYELLLNKIKKKK